MPLTLGSQYGGSWTNTAALVSQLQGAGVSESDLSTAFQTYVQRTGATGNDIPWWGDAAATRVYLQGLEWAFPDRYPLAFEKYSAAGFWTPQAEAAGQARTAAVGQAEQATHGGGGGLGNLGAIAAIAGIVTGGLGLIGAFADAAAGASLAETAAIAGAAGDAGFIGAAGATQLAGAGAGFSLAAAAGIAKNAYGVASGINTLTGGTSSGATPPPNRILQGSTIMANPLYLVNQDQMAGKQTAMPNTPGTQTTGAAVAAANASNSSMMGMSSDQMVIIAVLALSAWAFLHNDKA
jgi:hypothetical protein